MIIRLFLLLTLIGQVGPGTSDPAAQRLGGRGFGRLLTVIVILGVIVLAAIVVIAILAMTGRFENTLMDPAT